MINFELVFFRASITSISTHVLGPSNNSHTCSNHSTALLWQFSHLF